MFILTSHVAVDYTYCMVLDAIDHQIVATLLDDARISHVDLARRVSLSRPALLARLQKLQRAQIFRGFHADVSRATLGLPITAFINLRYAQQLTPQETARIRSLSGEARILELHHVAGEDCFILKVCAASVEDLSALLERIKDTREPLTSRTTLVLTTSFEKPYPRAAEIAAAKMRKGRQSSGAGKKP